MISDPIDDSALSVTQAPPAFDLSNANSEALCITNRIYASFLAPFPKSRSNDCRPIRHCWTSMQNKSSRYPTSILHLRCFLFIWNEYLVMGIYPALCLPSFVCPNFIVHIRSLSGSLGITGKGKKSSSESRAHYSKADLIFSC